MGGGCSSDPAAPADASTSDTSIPDTSVPIPDTSTADTSVADSAKDVAAPDASVDASASCATGPFQAFDPLGALRPLDTPKTDVTITTNICPAMAVVPYEGSATMNVPSNTPFFFIATQTGNLTNLSGERNVKIAAIPKIGYGAIMLPTSYAVAVDPAWNAATHALLNVVVNASTGTGICSAKDGVSHTVVGHAGAVVRYANGGTTSTGTGTSGDSLGTWISIPTTGTLTAPEYVTITQTKAGCAVGLNNADKLFFTGRAPIAAGVVTSTLYGEVTN